MTDSRRVCGSEVDCYPSPPTHTSAGYLNVEEGHTLLGLGIVPGHPVDRLWDEVQDEVEVELVLHLRGRGRGNVVNDRRRYLKECHIPRLQQLVFGTTQRAPHCNTPHLYRTPTPRVFHLVRCMHQPGRSLAGATGFLQTSGAPTQVWEHFLTETLLPLPSHKQPHQETDVCSVCMCVCVVQLTPPE